MTAARLAGGLLVGVVVAGMTAWSAGALYYSGPGGARLRTTLALGFVLATALAFLLLPHRRRTLAGFLVAFVALVTWWLRIPASNDRDWQPEVAVTPWVARQGDLVTVHGVRNFDYRTETDFVPRWETRTYDLRRLDAADLVAVYWGSKAIAHIMLSFAFGDEHLAVSIETRKERGESYSTIAGFFKQYELVYIVGDERDLIRVRTTYRHPQEDVYIYRLPMRPEHVRRVFLDYVRTINELHARPSFYNTLTTNCTTGARLHARVLPQTPPWSWKILLSGYVPQYLYELGRLNPALPFAELERRSWVNPQAHVAQADSTFSRRIREELPAPARLRDPQ